MKAVHLRTEYLHSPLGLGALHPRFMWNCDGGITQTAYQIVADKWDSGKIAGSSMKACYPLALSSREKVRWKIRLWDENDIPGEWEEDSFEMGLLQSSDWEASWISGDYRPKKGRRYPVDHFRKQFTPRGAIASARLYASARGVYDVKINGTRLESFILAPGATDYRKRIQYQTYDVTDLIVNNDSSFNNAFNNTIELRLADGWYRGSAAAYGVTNIFGDQTSVIAQLEITYEDGSVDKICTDDSWEWSSDGPIRYADLKDGEIYNAAMKASYNGKAIKVKAPAAELAASNNVQVTEHERFAPKMIGNNILDFGQNIAGYLEFTIRGRKGQRVTLTMGETLTDGHVDLSGIQESRPAGGWNQISLTRKLMTGKIAGKNDPTPQQKVVLYCSGSEDHYKTSFAVFGFRYVEIDGDIEIIPANYTAIAVYSDMDSAGDFRCSDERVNQLVRNTRWSMKGNFLDVPTDCPTRERLGWTGDAQVFFDTGAYLMDTSAFMAKWLRDMEDAQYKDGTIPAVIPYNGVEMMYKSTGTSAGWADAVYLVPYRYWKRYGDRDVLSRYYPMMKRYADYLLDHLEKDGHYEKGVHLGEWLEPEEFREKKYGAAMKHPEEATAYLYLTMSTMSEIAGELGYSEDAELFADAAKSARTAYSKYAELDTDRQARLVRPLALGLLEGEEKKSAEERLVRAVENYKYRVGTGFLSTPFILGVLTEAGEAETAYKMLANTEKPGWLYEVTHGATTVWESWEGDLSLNHYSPGAVCQWLFDTVAGIQAAGENHFAISPVPGGDLTYAEAEYLSMYGEVTSRWERTDDSITYTVRIPVNCSADFISAGGKQKHLTAGEYILTEKLI